MLAQVHFLLVCQSTACYYMKQVPSTVLHCFALKDHNTTMKQEGRLFQELPIQLFFPVK